MISRWRTAAGAAVVALAVGVPLAGAQTNAISTIAGTGTPGGAGDGGPASAAELNLPVSVSVTPDGGYLIADQSNNSIRRVSPGGTITTVAGSGSAGFSGDNGPATQAQLNAPSGVAMAADGSILIADANNNRIRRVSPDGTITTAVGTGAATFGGDGNQATAAQINFPYDVAPTSDGGYLIADVDNNRVRRVAPDGTISTAAGNGALTFGGDGGPATSASLADPSGVAVTPDGGFLIADTTNARVRRVAPDGTISTAAGTGTTGSNGDGGPATSAQLNGPARVAITRDGGFVIADRLNNRVRRVLPDGTITTAAGTGPAASSGDGGPASDAAVNGPFGVAVTGEGDFLITDTFGHRIRFVDAGAPPVVPPPELPTPTIGDTANATPIAGTVLVKLPEGTSTARAKALGLAGAATKFIPLSEARQVPVGSTFDTLAGTVGLTTAASSTDTVATQSGSFRGSLFVIKQRRNNPLATLELKGGGISKCKRGRSRKEVFAAARRRRLFSNARGRFRTRGRNSTATVRGTRWITTDSCAGTLTVVKSGSVVVRDFTKGRTKIVRAGKRYLARAPKPKRKQRRKR